MKPNISFNKEGLRPPVKLGVGRIESIMLKPVMTIIGYGPMGKRFTDLFSEDYYVVGKLGSGPMPLT